jgi:putative ABC transport system permease protein
MSRDVDVWVPRRPPSPMMLRRGMRDLFVVGRLRKGATIGDAQRELSTIAKRGADDDPTLNSGWGLRVISVREMIVGRVEPVLEMLAACVGMLVLIACANASAGGLARVTTKRQSLGVRLALGARPESIEQLLVAESMLLALIAAVVALPVSTIIRGVLVRIAPVSIPRQDGIAADGWTIGFGIVVALTMGVVASIGPRIWVRRLDVATFLSDAGRTSTASRTRSRTLTAFVVIQLALGTVLLAATARLYASFSRLNAVDPGFTSKSVTTATIALGGSRYQEPRARTALTIQLLEKVRALPGIERAAVTSLLPMSGGLMSSGYEVDGGASDSSMSAALRAVSPDFFSTLGIPIRQGRPIEQTDHASAARVVVVNRALERQSFAGSSALGKSITVAPPGTQSAESFTVVGIAGDAKEKDLLGPATPIIYFSDQQASFPHSVLVVRSRSIVPISGIQRALRELDPSLALDDVGSLASRVRSSYGLQLFLLTILGTFAASGAVLIAVGVYGAVSFAVTADLRSIGVRMALGATEGRILGALFRRTAVQAATGCTIGIAVALIVPRLLDAESLLGDASSGAALAGVLAVCVIAVVGTAIPARRAATLDPLAILRGD